MDVSTDEEFIDPRRPRRMKEKTFMEKAVIVRCWITQLSINLVLLFSTCAVWWFFRVFRALSGRQRTAADNTGMSVM